MFHPRPVAVPSTRPPGHEWLNGPLVWAIAEVRQAMYLFPRDCPRVLAWPVATTSAADRARWFGDSRARMIAHVERAWVDRLQAATLHRYEFAPAAFEDLGDADMWIARTSVVPVAVETIDDLPAALRQQGVELRVVDSLASLSGAWESSLHVSGVRLRNAKSWSADG